MKCVAECLFAAVFAVCACAQEPTVRAVTPVPRADAAWRTMHERQVASVAKEKPRVVFVGGSRAAELADKSLAPEWQGLFCRSALTAMNLAIPGDRLENVLWRVRQGILSGYEAKYVVLALGDGNEDDSVIDRALGVSAVIDAVRARQPKARIVLASLGKGECDENFDRVLKSFATGDPVIWVDANERPFRTECFLEGYFMPREPATRCPVLSPWWSRTFEKRRQVVASDGEFDVVMLGDSITHGWEMEGTGDVRRGKRLFDRVFSSYKVLNLGYSGQRIENLRWRLENGELDGYRARVFTLMIGTNNGNPPVCSADDIYGGIADIVGILRVRHPESKVVLCGLLPCGERNDNDFGRKAKSVNGRLAELADGKDVFLIDYSNRCADGQGCVLKEYLFDLCHPTEAGYAFWWDELKPLLERFCKREME